LSATNWTVIEETTAAGLLSRFVLWLASARALVAASSRVAASAAARASLTSRLDRSTSSASDTAAGIGVAAATLPSLFTGVFLALSELVGKAFFEFFFGRDA
jgi:hypothetical protein